MNNIGINVALPVAIVLGGLLVAGGLYSLRSEAEQVTPEAVAPRVEVLELKSENAVSRVEATGVVQPAQQIVLTPQVSGRMVWLSDAMQPGSRVDKGTVLARIDPTEYELLVEQARSTVRNAEVELELEKGRQRAAAREWELLGQGRSQEEAALALRKPQLQASQQALKAAHSSLEQAELNLQRTFLVAPFNAVILDESIDVGQVVGPQTNAATLVGTDEVWVKVSVPVDQLPAVQLPDEAQAGSPARVEQRLGAGASVVRDGSVVRLLGQLDPQTRTAQLLVAIPDPMETEEGGLPLLPGAYVDVAIDGRVLENVFRVPRTAVDGADKVWVVEREGTLKSRTVRIGWREAADVIVTDGLEDGARVVVSPLALPIENMAVEAVVRTDADEEN